MGYNLIYLHIQANSSNWTGCFGYVHIPEGKNACKYRSDGEQHQVVSLYQVLMVLILYSQ